MADGISGVSASSSSSPANPSAVRLYDSGGQPLLTDANHVLAVDLYGSGGLSLGLLTDGAGGLLTSPNPRGNAPSIWDFFASLSANGTTSLGTGLAIHTIYGLCLQMAASGTAAIAFANTAALQVKGTTSGTVVTLARALFTVGTSAGQGGPAAAVVRDYRSMPIKVCGTGGVLPTDTTCTLQVLDSMGTQAIVVSTQGEYT